MTIPEILKELDSYTGRFPMEAMRAAIEHRDAITPELLRVVEDVADDPKEFAERQDYMLHLFAMYLLAQFREKRTYRPLVRMFSVPGEISFDLVDDTVTDRLKRLLGSVYDGDPAPLQSLIEDENINEYVRGAALDAFIVLADSGQMSREEVATYYRSLFQGKLKRTQSHAWLALVCAVVDLPAPELLEEVRRAYKDELVDPGMADLEGIERDLLHPNPKHWENYAIITDAIKEMEWWPSFHPEDAKPRIRAPLPRSPAPPIRRTKIGRNEPCPCGSGKKYKKCCG